MDPRAGRTGKGRKAPSFLSLLLLQMRLHVHARLRASENDQLDHHRKMTGRAVFIFDLDQFWNRSSRRHRAGHHLVKRRGPEGPFQCYQRR